MGNNLFLFECRSMHQAEQITEGSWEWRKTLVKLIWWNPPINIVEETERIDSIWFRILGLPLHVWSQTTFEAIEDHCGGCLETEEETMLQNHLKWARIRMFGDGHNISKESSSKMGEFSFKLQIWVESPTRSIVEKEGIAYPFA